MSKSTLRKRIANQTNAQKSTGPKDTSLVRFNAIKSGIFAKVAVISGLESEADYKALLDSVMDWVNPQNAIEALLVERMVVYQWRLMRLIRAEAEQIKVNLMNKARSDLTLSELGVFEKSPQVEALDAQIRKIEYSIASPSESKILTYGKYESQLERGFYRALEKLIELRHNTKEENE